MNNNYPIIVINNLIYNNKNYGLIYYDSKKNKINFRDKDGIIYNLINEPNKDTNIQTNTENLNYISYSGLWQFNKSYKKNELIKLENGDLYICTKDISQSTNEPYEDLDNWEMIMKHNSNFKGIWIKGIEYNNDDIVIDPANKNIYVCKKDHKSFENPLNNKNWDLFLPKLDNTGDDTGDDTDEDIYSDSSDSFNNESNIDNLMIMYFKDNNNEKIHIDEKKNIIILPFNISVIDRKLFDSNEYFIIIKSAGVYEITYNIEFQSNLDMLVCRLIHSNNDPRKGVDGYILTSTINNTVVKNEFIHTINHHAPLIIQSDYIKLTFNIKCITDTYCNKYVKINTNSWISIRKIN